MNRSQTVRLVSIATLGMLALSASVLALISMNSGGGLSVAGADLLPIAAGYDRRAQAALASATPPAAAHEEASARSRSAIAQYPYDTGAWLRLAYVDTLQHGRLTPAGVAALQRSYDLVAVDPDFAVWRIGFALQHVEALPAPLLALVAAEVRAVWPQGEYRKPLLNLRNELTSPAGRLALLLWINDLQRRDAKFHAPAAFSRTSGVRY